MIGYENKELFEQMMNLVRELLKQDVMEDTYDEAIADFRAWVIDTYGDDNDDRKPIGWFDRRSLAKNLDSVLDLINTTIKEREQPWRKIYCVIFYPHTGEGFAMNRAYDVIYQDKEIWGKIPVGDFILNETDHNFMPSYQCPAWADRYNKAGCRHIAFWTKYYEESETKNTNS